jgi:hypothetical protein
MQNQEFCSVDIRRLSAVATSKHEIYRILVTEGQLYLPPERTISMYFIKDILTGQK